MASSGSCCYDARSKGTKLPLICLVPKDGSGLPAELSSRGQTKSSDSTNEIPILPESYLRKNFKIPQRSLYLDSHRRPLITFPTGQENNMVNFNLAKKTKTNQMILDGFLDPSCAINGKSVYPYEPIFGPAPGQAKKEDEEVIYILQLPDQEIRCPMHNETIRIPRFVWHTQRKAPEVGGELKPGPGPLHKPKPWLLSRHVDFDCVSQCPEILKGLSPGKPMVVQLNPDGQWTTSKPTTIDENQLQAVLQYLKTTSTTETSGAESSKRSNENEGMGDAVKHAPVILIPSQSAEYCDCDKETRKKRKKEKSKKEAQATENREKGDTKKSKTPSKEFVLQRFTDFDLLSQW